MKHFIKYSTWLEAFKKYCQLTIIINNNMKNYYDHKYMTKELLAFQGENCELEFVKHLIVEWSLEKNNVVLD